MKGYLWNILPRNSLVRDVCVYQVKNQSISFIQLLGLLKLKECLACLYLGDALKLFLCADRLQMGCNKLLASVCKV